MVFVLDANKKPLSPCHEAVARKLLKQGDLDSIKPIKIILGWHVTNIFSLLLNT